MAPGSTAASSGQNGSAISKLNPECKPFSPTRKYNNKQATDENENNLRWNQEDKMRKIWNFSKSPKPQSNDKENYKVVAKPKQLHPMSPNEPDDYGLRSLMRNISLSSSKNS